MSLAFPKFALLPPTGTFPLLAWSGTNYEPSSTLSFTPGANLLVINNNALTLPGAPAANDTMLQVGGLDATTTRILVDGFGGSPSFTGRRANGTNAISTGVIAGSVLAQFNGLGYTSAGAYTTAAGVSVQLQGNETWDATNQATKIILAVTPTGGSTTQAAVATFLSAGHAFATTATSTFTVSDAATTTTPTIFTLTHASSGTAANGYGSTITINGQDDGGTQRGMALLSTAWTTAATATRASNFKIAVQVAAVSTVGFTLASTSATFASGFPVTISDSTVSSSVGTGCLILSGGMGTAGAVNATLSIQTATRFNNTGTSTTAASTGICSMWRSGGTIGNAGDMVLQTDLAVNGAFVFRSGITTPATVLTIGTAGVITTIDGSTIVAGTSTGLTVGTGITQKLGFYNATPIAQRAGAAQAAVVTTGSALASYGYTQAQADAIVSLVNELRNWAVAQGFIKGAA